MKNSPYISIYSNVDMEKILEDKRSGTRGIVFGRVSDVCRQLGISVEEMPYCKKFSAPKNRLQIFVEKLHFSRTYYTDIPF